MRGLRRRRRCGTGCISGHGDARLKQRAFIGLIFRRDPHRHRLHALEARGRLEIGALLAAMQGDAALGAFAGEIGVREQWRGTVVTARGRHRLHQTWKPGAGDVDRRPRALRPRPIVVPIVMSSRFAVRFVITALLVLAFAVHKISGLTLLLCKKGAIYLGESIGFRPRIKECGKCLDSPKNEQNALSVSKSLQTTGTRQRPYDTKSGNLRDWCFVRYLAGTTSNLRVRSNYTFGIKPAQHLHTI